MTKPGAQAYYDSIVGMYAGWDVAGKNLGAIRSKWLRMVRAFIGLNRARGATCN